MALGQLQHLEALFVSSGWLAARCESFNRENAEAIADGTKFRQSPNLYALDTFVVTPMSKPGICGAREHDEQQTIAEAHGVSSFSELVNPFGVFVHCFVSHFWGHDFTSTVTALDLWADVNYNKMTSEKQALVYWICLFALNQHNVAEEVGEKPQQGPFNAALAQAIGGAVMVLDEEIKPFSRIWCLFEASRLRDLQRPFELICSEGSLSQPEKGGRLVVSAKMLEATCKALWNVSAAKAQSSVAADKYQIWGETANESLRSSIEGVGAELWFNDDAIEKLGDNGLAAVFSNFDRYMRSLLSTTVLKILMARGDWASAAKCCIHGAHVSAEQLAQICHSFAEESQRRAWLNRMLMRASSASMAKLLLEQGADPEAADNDGVTALMYAAEYGHEAVAQLLLQHRADVTAAQNDGFTPLMEAVLADHEAMAQLLLLHGADVRAAMHNGVTALMLSAIGGHDAVARLLLQHGADVRAAHNGSTPLMEAAKYGHEAVAELLLQHSADVRAANTDGVTALLLAAKGGHEAVGQLLLQHGADVRTAQNDGLTALMCAAEAGHEAVAQLLLQHGADARAAMNDGLTALMFSAVGGDEAVAHLLLQHGADVRAARTDGLTALMCAALGGHEAVAHLLLQHGADVRAADNNGVTALMCSAAGGHEAVAQLLLQHSADARAANHGGVSALMMATSNRHEAVARLLREHGGGRHLFQQCFCS
eukprot:s173_g24.t1